MKMLKVGGIMFFLFCLMLDTVVLAQPDTSRSRLITREAMRVSPEFRSQLNASTNKLNDIENILRQIETTKQINKNTSVNLDTKMEEYANEMKVAYEKALKDAEVASNSNGREGNIASLISFENTAKIHERRIENIQLKILNIETNVKTGTIILERSLIQNFNTEEKEELRRFLKPEGIRKYERISPGILGNSPGPSGSIGFPEVNYRGLKPAVSDLLA